MYTVFFALYYTMESQRFRPLKTLGTTNIVTKNVGRMKRHRDVKQEQVTQIFGNVTLIDHSSLLTASISYRGATA